MSVGAETHQGPQPSPGTPGVYYPANRLRRGCRRTRAAHSILRIGARPRLPARGGAANLLPHRTAHLRPLFTPGLQQRLSRTGQQSATQCSRSVEERPGLARSAGFLLPAPPELEN
ncbi:hypothetical protein NDU88_005133 [Pleurodeles waltl]|uniref:Uncharacterized protein n=1 Tax=Pleurodeles waltl TaxID=8319 RepID=A0AAV7PH94_PLEWA|nr:hypothetical protein NDU88_005133 [Pleurodeles waltl]